MKEVKLNDGNMIPAVGFGVFLIPNDGSTYKAVRKRLMRVTGILILPPHISMNRKLGEPYVNPAFPGSRSSSRANCGFRIMAMMQP